MPITHTVELIAALTGVLLFRKYRQGNAKYFIYFLIYLTFFDFVCRYTSLVTEDGPLNFLIGTRFEKNHWLSTLFWKIGAIMFFSFYFSKILKNKRFKGIVKYAGYIFLLFSLIYIGLNWEVFFYKFFPVLGVLGAIVIFLCAVFYFIELLQSERILTFYKSLNFYISAAIFIWWLIITPIVFYDVYFTYEIGNSNRDWDFIFLRWQIYMFANIIMYSTFTFALIWCKPEND